MLEYVSFNMKQDECTASDTLHSSSKVIECGDCLTPLNIEKELLLQVSLSAFTAN